MKTMTEHFNEESHIHEKNFIVNMGMTEFYDEIEKQIENCYKKDNILVLGCGTGLEIERIKSKSNVTAVDISPEMLKQLEKKELCKEIKLKTVCGNFLDMDFGTNIYDIVLTCYAMHHFKEEQKFTLYKKIYNCLLADGVFINGDITSETQDEEQRKLNNAKQIYKEKNMQFGELHVDIPLYFEHEKEILEKAGFNLVHLERKWTKTKLYKAFK